MSQLHSVLEDGWTNCCAQVNTHAPPSHNDFKLFFLFSFINSNLFMKQVMTGKQSSIRVILSACVTYAMKIRFKVLPLLGAKICWLYKALKARRITDSWVPSTGSAFVENTHTLTGLSQAKVSQMLYKVSAIHSAQVLRSLVSSCSRKLIWCLLTLKYLRIRRLRICQCF